MEIRRYDRPEEVMTGREARRERRKRQRQNKKS
jgi:hypothetical protein